MLRRFEMCAIRAELAAGKARELAALLRDCGRHIPELLDSAIGWNRSRAGVQLVWEQAYESARSYQRYMEHAYHACVIDRHVLPDHPERITAEGEPGLGLLGYELDAPRHRLDRGIRRVFALRLREGAEPQRVAALEQCLGAAREAAPELALSICAQNSMGLEWSDAFTQVWEQGFESEWALRSYLAGDSLPARTPRARFAHPETALVERTLEVWYAIEPARGPALRSSA